jgi:hypothetical protein
MAETDSKSVEKYIATHPKNVKAILQCGRGTQENSTQLRCPVLAGYTTTALSTKLSTAAFRRM